MTEEAEVALFTVEKANRALPLVRRIVADITAEHPRWRDLVARYELVAGGARSDLGESNEMLALRHEVDRIAALIAGFVAELEQIGVTIKGFDDGLVDFYGNYEGRLVCLCWKEGEESVSHWHELEAGFAGRQPITPEFIAGQEPAHSQGG
jgi:hypothetical protein